MPNNLPIHIEFLEEDDHRYAVRSLELAKHFGKNHKEILRNIEKLKSQLPKVFTGRNFALSEYEDSTGRTLPCYLLSRDAFTLLVMGWSGPKALSWKLKYIEAFNGLEKAALENARLAAKEEQLQLIDNKAGHYVRQGLALAKRLSPERRREIKKARRYAALGLSNREVARLLKCSGVKAKNLLSEGQWLLKGGQNA